MNREQFLGFMESPAKLKADSLVLLEGLLKEFPYCQTARMLYLKALHNQKSIHYNSQLKITAAYAGNRKNLFQLILQSDSLATTNPPAAGTALGENKSEVKAKPPVFVPKPFIKTVVVNNNPLEKKVDQKEETSKTKLVNAENPLPIATKPVQAQPKPIEKAPANPEKDKPTLLKPIQEAAKTSNISKDKPQAIIPDPVKVTPAPIATTPEKNILKKEAPNIIEPVKKEIKTAPVIKEEASVIPEPAKVPHVPVDKVSENIVPVKDETKILEPAKEIIKTEAINKEKAAVIPEPSKASPAPVERNNEKNPFERDKPNIAELAREAIKKDTIIEKNTAPVIPDPVKVPTAPFDKTSEKIVPVKDEQKIPEPAKETIKTEAINKEEAAVIAEPSKAPPAPVERNNEKDPIESDKPNIAQLAREAIKPDTEKNTVPVIPDPVKVLPEAPEKAKEVETTQKTSGQEKENINEDLSIEDNIDFNDGIEELEQEILNEAISAAIQTEEMPAHREVAIKEPVEKAVKKEDAFLNETGQHSFTQWLKLVDKNNENPLTNTSELVEKFINEAPKIKPVKTEFFSPVNMARLSMIEDWTFVTETLAKVYAKQGNYLKAIKAYENLILKYPEKNAYFAAQIHSLKEKNSK